MSMTKTDIPLADATATGGKEDPSPVPGVGVDEYADADTEEAVAAAPDGVKFEVEGDEEGDDKLGNEDTNPRGYVTWESRGASYQFANNPMRACVWILLVLRAVQMGINFGTNFIESGFLTGVYNPTWNPGFSSSKANTFISASMGLNNSLPFLVAFVADFLTGDYWMILILLIVFYLPGIAIITFCAWPYLIGDEFPITLYRVGFQILYSIGNGGIDTIVDIFGAKQFHPVIHTYLLDSYFVWSAVMAGVGGVTAELVYCLTANAYVTISYGLMFIALLISTLLFVYGTKRYIVRKNNMKDNVLTARAMLSAALCWKTSEQGQLVACPPGFNKVKKSRGGRVRDELVTAARRLALVVPVQGLFIPVNVAWSQMVAILIPMSYSMQHPKMWTGTNMVFVNSSHVVLFGILANKFFYPYLEKKNIKLSTAHQVAIGSVVMALMYFALLGIDHRMRRVYAETGEMISIGWQYFPYAIGGLGAIFTLPPQDAITYRVAPSEWKVLGNAVNKFMQQGISNFICLALYKRTEAWFTPSNSSENNIIGIANYTSASSNKFMWIMVGFALLQAVICALPWVNRWYIKIEKYCEARSDQ